MSEMTTPSRSAGGNQRRRSRRGRGRHDRHDQHDKQGQQNQRENRGGRRHGERRPPGPPPLTWWQKLLKAIGLYRPAASAAARPESIRREPKVNTRVAGTPVEEPKAAPPVAAARPQAVESPRLYVGNLSYDATESDLEELFKGFGSVRNVEIVYNRRTQRSKGYAFVSMHHLDDAKRAVEVLHDQPFMGRKLIVNGAVSEGPADADEADDE